MHKILTTRTKMMYYEADLRFLGSQNELQVARADQTFSAIIQFNAFARLQSSSPVASLTKVLQAGSHQLSGKPLQP